MSKIRVAAVGYTNAWPLTRYLDRSHFEVLESVPSEAARKLRAGEADLGLIPVGALLNDGDAKVVPGLAIGCDGDVASVLLVGETPLSEWDTVALDGESRTSVLLAQILLKGPLGRPDIRVVDVDAGTGAFHAQGRTGAVVIGDAALNLPERLRHRIDLGRVWKDWTDLPFVFAVWASKVALSPEDVASLQKAAAEGLASRVHASPRERAYLTENIRYTLDDRALMGLRRFAALGRQMGLLRREEFSLLPPPARHHRQDVGDLLAKAAEGQRLRGEEGLKILREAPLDALGAAAQARRLALHPDKQVGYTSAGNLDYSYHCPAACSFCAFRGAGPAMEASAITARLGALKKMGATTVILQGGLDPALDLDWHAELVAMVRREGFRVLGYGPDEVAELAGRSGVTVEDVLDRLAASGLDGMPGAGAEVLVDRVRQMVAPRKLSVENWVSVMKAAQRRGLGGTASLLMGLGEGPEERVEHLLRLREIQEETGGFARFVAWLWAPTAGQNPPDNTPASWLRMTAFSRLMLDNVPYIQAGWVSVGLDVAEAALWMGANDIGPIFLDGSALAQRATETAPKSEIERYLRAAGLEPVCRDPKVRSLV